MDAELLTFAIEAIIEAKTALAEGQYDHSDRKMDEAKDWIERARG